MSSSSQPPTGAARRRKRMSDADTRQRMLDTAVQLITQRGMSVSLEHLSFEEIIQAAGVARTSVYRRWPYKDLFFSDVLVELARATALGSGYAEVSQQLADRLEALLPRPRDVDDERDRRDVTIELLRVASLADFEAVYTSQQWRTYIALHATHLGLPDGDLRREVGRALAASDRRFTEARAANLRLLAGLAGYRVATDVGGETDGFALLSLAIGAAMTGLVIKALTAPALVTDRRRLAPFGTSWHAEWSEPALVLAHLMLSHLEPVPGAPWGDNQIRRMITELRALATDQEPSGR